MSKNNQTFVTMGHRQETAWFWYRCAQYGRRCNSRRWRRKAAARARRVPYFDQPQNVRERSLRTKELMDSVFANSPGYATA